MLIRVGLHHGKLIGPGKDIEVSRPYLGNGWVEQTSEPYHMLDAPRYLSLPETTRS